MNPMYIALGLLFGVVFDNIALGLIFGVCASLMFGDDS
jgi:hypothetical protein